MTITNETRKRLWALSGNLCALCRRELFRRDSESHRGALVGEEAHIVAKAPGGPRYGPLDRDVRDGYDNLILLCASDHTEVDRHPLRFTQEALRQLKHDHESWVRERLRSDTHSHRRGAIPAVIVESGSQLWSLLSPAFGWQFDSPDDLSDAEADLIDGILQDCADWCDISSDVEANGFRAVRDAKRSLTADLEALSEAGFVVLGGQGDVSWGSGVAGPLVVLKILRPSELDTLPTPASDAG